MSRSNFSSQKPNEMSLKFENDDAISPIVATLVLIVVVVVGAVAVGSIMGTFSSDVSKMTSTKDISGASSTEISLAGSNLMKDINKAIAKSYNSENPGVKVSVQGGGSDAGIMAVEIGALDIGASNKVKSGWDAIHAKYPNLKTHQIGGTGAVFIIKASGSAPSSLTKDQIRALFEYETPVTTGGEPRLLTDAVQIGLEGPIEKIVCTWLTNDESQFPSSWQAEKVWGDNDDDDPRDEVLEKVKSSNNIIGFVNYGKIDVDWEGVEILSIDDPIDGYTYTDPNTVRSDFLTELREMDGSGYVNGLVRPLYYVTDGEPSSLEADFIRYAQSPECKDIAHAAFHISEIGKITI